MKLKRVMVILALLLVTALPLACATASAPKLRVVTTTTLMAGIVREVGGDRVEVTSIVPPSQHPGNFDARPGDIQQLAAADLFLVHGWPGEGFVPALVSSASNPKLKVVTVSAPGNWMMPPIQLQAVDKVVDVLIGADSQGTATYQQAAGAYKKSILATEADVKDKLIKAKVSSAKVIASERQADFLQWAGFQVIATYGEAQTLTPQTVKGLVDKGKQSGVTLVVDNLQSSKDAGKGLAEELGAKQLNLSNFLGGYDDTTTWPKAINYNVELILAALGQKG